MKSFGMASWHGKLRSSYIHHYKLLLLPNLVGLPVENPSDNIFELIHSPIHRCQLNQLHLANVAQPGDTGCGYKTVSISFIPPRNEHKQGFSLTSSFLSATARFLLFVNKSIKRVSWGPKSENGKEECRVSLRSQYFEESVLGAEPSEVLFCL